jgi:CheY-like chemotaxis protein
MGQKFIENKLPDNILAENNSTGEKADKKTLLIVDQSNVVREVLKKACHKLLPFGITIVEATSGMDAAIKIFSGLRPNVVVTDISMSLLSGFELINFLKTYPEEAVTKTPVILISGMEPESSSKPKNYQIFSKPFPVKDFCQAVEDCFSQNHEYSSEDESKKSLHYCILPKDFDA